MHVCLTGNMCVRVRVYTHAFEPKHMHHRTSELARLFPLGRDVRGTLCLNSQQCTHLKVYILGTAEHKSLYGLHLTAALCCIVRLYASFMQTLADSGGLEFLIVQPHVYVCKRRARILRSDSPSLTLKTEPSSCRAGFGTLWRCHQ